MREEERVREEETKTWRDSAARQGRVADEVPVQLCSMASDLAAARRLLEDLFAGAGLDDGSEDASDGEHFDGEDGEPFSRPLDPRREKR